MGESGDEWDFHRIGTETEKSSVAKELVELRERLSKVEEWKKRRQDIEDELNKVWVEGGDELSPPSYIDITKDTLAAGPEESTNLEDSQTTFLSNQTSESS